MNLAYPVLGRLVAITKLNSRPRCESATTAAVRTMAKVVLVLYLERTKKISIPEHKSEGDVEYLRKEFLKKFYPEKNVEPQSAQITFQHFDPEWEEYVDLEDDAVVPNNMKLKAIVTTPRLSRLLTIDGSPTTSRSILIIDSQVTIHMTH